MRTLASDIMLCRGAILTALKEHAANPEVCVAAMADIIGAVAADLTVGGQDGTITLDQRMDLFIERARQAYRRRITTVTMRPRMAELNGMKG